MQGPPGCRPPEDEATRAIFVLGILFNHFGAGEEFSHFLDADTTDDALVSRMFGELELVRLNFPSYLVDHRHAQLMFIEAYEFMASALRWLTPGMRGANVVSVPLHAVVRRHSFE
jgi:hypothetical protein